MTYGSINKIYVTDNGQRFAKQSGSYNRYGRMKWGVEYYIQELLRKYKRFKADT